MRDGVGSQPTRSWTTLPFTSQATRSGCQSMAYRWSHGGVKAEIDPTGRAAISEAHRRAIVAGIEETLASMRRRSAPGNSMSISCRGVSRSRKKPVTSRSLALPSIRPQSARWLNERTDAKAARPIGRCPPSMPSIISAAQVAVLETFPPERRQVAGNVRRGHGTMTSLCHGSGDRQARGGGDGSR